MTTSEIYEQIRAHFTRPGAQLSKREYSSHGTCYYRHPEDGRACAVGCLFTDAEHDAMMEELVLSGTHLVRGGAISASAAVLQNLASYPERLRGDEQDRFLAAVQCGHDGSKTVEAFLAKLDEVAARYSLRND